MSNENYTKRELDALRHIRNTIIHQGKSPSIRNIMTFLGYKSPHSAMLIVDKFIEDGFLRRKPNGDLQVLKESTETADHAQTVNVPLVGTVPAGLPLLAEENFEMMLPVSTRLAKPPHQYFLLRAVGDSMNKKGINDGSLVLVRQQPDADNGQSVIALINDEATVKEIHKTSDVIVLKPKSTNPEHKPIVLTEDFQIQGIVVATFPEFSS